MTPVVQTALPLSALAALVGGAFAWVVISRWQATKRAAFLAWGAGLTMFALGALFQALGEIKGFAWGPGDIVFRGFYLFGGVLGVIILALGTVHLMAPKKVAKITTWAVVALSIAVGIDSLLVPVDESKLIYVQGVLGGALASHANLLYFGVVFFNIVGSLILIVGSAWSAWKFIRTRQAIDRVICNVLLTTGAFVVATGFSLAKTSGLGLQVLGGVELIGIGVMFAGFLALGRIKVPATTRVAATH